MARAPIGSRCVLLVLAALVPALAACGTHHAGGTNGSTTSSSAPGTTAPPATTGPSATSGTTGAGSTTTSTDAPTTTAAGGNVNEIEFEVGGGVGIVTSANVVCNTPVATSSHKFFFDVSGVTTNGQSTLFSGTIPNYSGPATYTIDASYAPFVARYGSTPYAGSARGSIAVTGPSAFTLSVTISGHPGSIYIIGSLTCTSTTTS